MHIGYEYLFKTKKKEKEKMYFKLLQIIMNLIHIWTWKLYLYPLLINNLLNGIKNETAAFLWKKEYVVVTFIEAEYVSSKDWLQNSL